MQAERAPNTVLSYESSWRHFAEWCKNAGRTPLPADADTVALYSTWVLESGGRIGSMRTRLIGLANRHKSAGLPWDQKKANALINNAARERKEEPGGKQALTVEQLKRIAALPVELPIEYRDRAIVIFGWFLGRRVSELGRLDLRDLKFSGEGVRVRIRFSKNDQTGKGEDVDIPREE